MKKLFILLITVMAAGFVACNKSGQTSSPVSGNALSGKTYQGITPCADCSGIHYELTLNNDQTFKASSMYIGKSVHPFIDQGSWKIKNDTLLILKPDDGRERALVVGDSTLTMLDGDQNYVTGPMADMFVLTLKNEKSNSNQDHWSDLRKRGVDFRASGNEPFWGVTIDFGGKMTFNQMDGDSIVVDLPEMKKDTASKARTFTAETKTGPLSVKLYPTGCVDDMSGKFFKYGVNVEYGDQVYRGCGNFINKKYKLNDYWTLHSLNGSEVKTDSLMRTPKLNFNLQKNHVSGNSGCNLLSGSFEIQDQNISFNKLISTKMACRGSMKFEQQFLDALNKVESYEISNWKLKLNGADSTLMVLYRAK